VTDLLPGTSEPVSPSDTAPLDHVITSDVLEHAAREYLFQYGWSARVSGRVLHLRLDDDQALVLVPEHWAPTVLDQLVFGHLDCPVVRIPGYAWGFLTTHDGKDDTEPVPGGTRILGPGSTAPLPPSPSEYGELTWIRPPQPNAGLDVTISDIVTAIEKVIDTTPLSRLVPEQARSARLMSIW
jgi:hypothetical protein